MDEQAFPTVFFWPFSNVWHRNRGRSESQSNHEQKGGQAKSKEVCSRAVVHRQLKNENTEHLAGGNGMKSMVRQRGGRREKGQDEDGNQIHPPVAEARIHKSLSFKLPAEGRHLTSLLLPSPSARHQQLRFVVFFPTRFFINESTYKHMLETWWRLLLKCCSC